MGWLGQNKEMSRQPILFALSGGMDYLELRYCDCMNIYVEQSCAFLFYLFRAVFRASQRWLSLCFCDVSIGVGKRKKCEELTIYVALSALLLETMLLHFHLWCYHKPVFGHSPYHLKWPVIPEWLGINVTRYVTW